MRPKTAGGGSAGSRREQSRPDSRPRLFRDKWPRTTLWRTVLLLALLFLVSQGMVFVLYHRYVLDPAARRFAEFLLQSYRAIPAPATPPKPSAAPPPATLRWLASDASPGTASGNYFFAQSARAIARLAPGATLRMGSGSPAGTWVWIRGGAGRPWLGMRVSPINFGGSTFLLIRLMIIALFTFLGAILIVRQINLPLLRLAEHARSIGRGEVPETLPSISGPAEVQELEQAIQRMARDLHTLHEERAILLTGISHELRTPLSRLLLALHLPDGPLLEQKEAMQVDVTEMDEILDKFLALVRSGQEEKSIVSSPEALLAPMAEIGRERYGLEIGMATPPALPRVAYRPMAMERVFRNLFDNAARYGGGRLEITAHQEAAEIVFRLRDFGPGVPSAYLSLLGNTPLPNQRGVTHGSGIGLRIGQRIIALQGGSLRFANAQGGGLEVEIRLPLGTWR
ncbi:MAG: ATP-binding protein [Acidithiobacillus sp.]|uniref:ATP-binding protein n=1 Tax=Acidithiobacillus sp. TaxID=1872118 RepID=UPI003D091F18